MTETERDLIDACMDGFNFERVHKVMTYLDWHWQDYVPGLFEIKQFARKLFKDAIERGDKRLERYDTACGGFHVVIYRERGVVVFVELNFVLATSECDLNWTGE